MQDDKLIKKLHKEPEKGMKILMEQYTGLVYAVVRSKMLSSVFSVSDIENCVADTFSEFYMSLDRYDLSCGSIKAWLCVIAKNNAIDCLRRSYRDKELVFLDAEGVNEQYADGFSLELSIENKELRRNVMKAVKDLGNPDCEIIVRKFYLSQSSKEIAQKMNMTVANIDTRTHRAIKKLREKFGGDF